ncbi:MAG TPA: MFS transporter [Eubacteriaceae bacterium]|jgi:EmrB/QacA subfamily drug resistance transporter|nr:MFS transporter [Eubacteriaceae bacterium]
MDIDKKSRNAMFGALLIGSIISSMLQTSLTTTLPAIMSEFSVEAATGQWLTSGYTLAMGVMIPATAFLLRRFETRKLFVFSMGVFGVGTLLSAIAYNFSVMMTGRVLQAIGNGILLAMVQVVILTVFPMNKRGFIMGIYGLAVGGAPVVAPTIAGIVVDIFNWRIIFWSAFIISIINIIYGLFAVKNVLDVKKMSFDIKSMLLGSLGFTSLLYSLGNLGAEEGIVFKIILPAILGVFMLIVFVKRQLQLKDPFLEIRILNNTQFRLSVIISMLLYSAMIGGAMILPMYMQIARGLSATMSGLIMMPGSLILALLNPYAGMIYDRFGIRRLSITGSIFVLLGTIPLCFLTESTEVFYLIASQTIRLIGIGCLMMPIVTWGMSTLEKEGTSHGTALLSSLRTISGAIGTAVLVAVMGFATKLMNADANQVVNVFGINGAFVVASIISALQLTIVVLYVGKKDRASNLVHYNENIRNESRI